MSAATFPTAAPAIAPSQVSRRGEITRWIAGLHDEITSFFGRLDGGGTFLEDRWERPGGGGGVARVMTDGITFEKAGINRSAVMGELPELAARRVGGRGAAAGATHFFATGVSLVIHPRSPMVPTVHLNVRYFELTDEQGQITDSWFGGGTDLTPFYPHEEDPRTFHSALKLTEDLLLGLGLPRGHVDRTIDTFRRHDEQRLQNDFTLAGDEERLSQRARKAAEELERLFAQDAAELDNIETTKKEAAE